MIEQPDRQGYAPGPPVGYSGRTPAQWISASRIPGKTAGAIREQIAEQVVEMRRPTVEERIVEIPQVVNREFMVDDMKKVFAEKIKYVPRIETVERVTHVPKHVTKEVIRDVPQVQIVERTIEVPTTIFQDVTIPVAKPVVQERTTHISKPVYVEKVVDFPRFVQRPVPVDRVVEVPHTHIQYIHRDVQVPRHVLRPVSTRTRSSAELPNTSSAFNVAAPPPHPHWRQLSAPLPARWPATNLLSACCLPEADEHTMESVGYSSYEPQKNQQVRVMPASAYRVRNPVTVKEYKQQAGSSSYSIHPGEKAKDTPRSSTARGRFLLSPTRHGKPVCVSVSNLPPRMEGPVTVPHVRTEARVPQKILSFQPKFRNVSVPYSVVPQEPWISTKLGMMKFSEFDRLNVQDALSTTTGFSMQHCQQQVDMSQAELHEGPKLAQKQHAADQAALQAELQRQEMEKRELELKNRLAEDMSRCRSRSRATALQKQHELSEQHRRELEELMEYQHYQRKEQDERVALFLREQEVAMKRLLDQQKKQQNTMEKDMKEHHKQLQQHLALLRLQQEQAIQHMQDDHAKQQQRLSVEIKRQNQSDDEDGLKTNETRTAASEVLIQTRYGPIPYSDFARLNNADTLKGVSPRSTWDMSTYPGSSPAATYRIWEPAGGEQCNYRSTVYEQHKSAVNPGSGAIHSYAFPQVYYNATPLQQAYWTPIAGDRQCLDSSQDRAELQEAFSKIGRHAAETGQQVYGGVKSALNSDTSQDIFRSVGDIVSTAVNQIRSKAAQQIRGSEQ